MSIAKSAIVHETVVIAGSATIELIGYRMLVSLRELTS